MANEWVSRTGWRSIDLRQFGFVPHSRFMPNSWIGRQGHGIHWRAWFEEQEIAIRSFPFWFVCVDSSHLQEQFIALVSNNNIQGNWTAFTWKRQKNVFFGFDNEESALYAKLVLE